MREYTTRPFKALLYNKDLIQDISSCVCPPYDVITDKEPYLKKSEYNIIRLELPEPEPPLNQYESAKRILKDWIGKKILIEDKEHAIYVYEQRFSYNEKTYLRRGFVALNKIGNDRVLIHEATRSQAKKDREMLISTLKTFTSFVFGLYEDKVGEIDDFLLHANKQPIYTFKDEHFVENTIYRLHEKDEINKLCALMNDKKIYIADGHHRLDVSYRLKLEYIPIYLTNMHSDGILIWPYHRVVKFKKQRNLYELIKALSEFGEIEKKAIKDKNSIKECIEMISKESRPSFAFYSKEEIDKIYILKLERQMFYRDEMHRVLKGLKVNILHAGILNNLLGIEEDEISFTQDAYAYLDSLKDGYVDLIVLLPPTTVEEVKAVADNALYMPPKSTYFYPKITTGPIIYSYD